MPSVMTHAVVGLGVGAVMSRSRTMPRPFWVLSAGLAMLPDIDVVTFWLGVPHPSLWSHRGFSHSLCAALLGAAAAALFGRRWSMPWWRLGLTFGLVMASHGFLDALTNGGNGIAFFAPFDATRYFFPWRPLEVSPIGVDFFSARGLRIFESELARVWPPTIVIAGIARSLRAPRIARTG